MTTHKLAKRWTSEEDQILLANHPSDQTTSKWKEISKIIFKGTRNASQCAQRYFRLRHPTKQTMWTESEDNLVRKYVKEFGECKWTKCAQLMMSEHSGKQIRERWREILRPEIRRTQWTYNEDQQILVMWKKIGKKWKQMSQQENLKGRTENQIKNRFNSFVKKYLIDDNTNENGFEALGSTELIQEEELQIKINLNTESSNFIDQLFNEQWNLIEDQENPVSNFNLTLNTSEDQFLQLNTNNSQLLYDQQLSLMSNPKTNCEFDFSHCLEPIEDYF